MGPLDHPPSLLISGTTPAAGPWFPSSRRRARRAGDAPLKSQDNAYVVRRGEVLTKRTSAAALAIGGAAAAPASQPRNNCPIYDHRGPAADSLERPINSTSPT